MKSKKNTTMKINISKEDTNINDFLYCWDKFGDRPNKITIYSSFTKDGFNTIISKYNEYKNSNIELIPADDFDIINDKSIVKISDNIFVSYHILDRESENSFIHEVIFLYKSEEDLEKINEITEKLGKYNIELEEGEDCYKLNTVFISQNGLEVEPIEKIKLDESIELFYNETTFKSINKLNKTLKKSNKGLTILYGERGTGKTSMVNYICDKLDRMVIYIPNNMLEVTINSPEFRTFLRKYPKPIIVLDDCEMIFNELYSKSNIYVNNILQMVDGLLADSIELNIITIFNVDDENEIDHVLLECNSLIDVIEFELLNQEESNDLAKHLGSKKKYKNKNKLVDIIKTNNNTKSYKKIGLN
jgi:tRNA A37 threonylcarbamoyladenosine biosynthesis protein TsaE